MRSMMLFAVLAALATGCGKKDGGGGGGGNGLDTPDGVIAAAKARTDAMCACADQQCRLDVTGKPDDPFGEKARAARDKFDDGQKKAFAEITHRWVECSTKK